LAEAVPDDLRYTRAPGAIHNRIGDLLHSRDDLTGALNRYRIALSAAERLAQAHPQHPELQRDLAICHDNLGDTLSGLDDPQEADHHFKAFLSIAESPENRPAFKDLRAREIAAVHMKLGRGREAEKMPRLALERYIQARTMIEKLAIDFPENQRLREDLQWLRHKILRLSERLEADDRRIARNRANIPENPDSEGSADWQGDA
jgi:tetratricopeptide (TPR) repeat protein